MSSIVHKPNGTLVVTVRITLKPGRDDALIQVIKSAPPRTMAASIREAMRSGVTMTMVETETDPVVILPDLGIEL